MIDDLDRGGSHTCEADVLVIGGGTVGLVIGARLAERGRRVIVVESGGLEQPGETHELNEVVQARRVYSGAMSGRFRCLGGTSTRWGGALIPFAPADFRADEWPLDPADVLKYVPAVEKLFGLTRGPYETEDIFPGTQHNFRARLAKWPTFPRRNVATLFADRLRALPTLQIWLNATATEFDVAAGKLRNVKARSRKGGQLEIRAREVVIAAGAIETTRLLLLMDQQNSYQLFRPDGQLGRFFSDHLSVAAAEVIPSNRDALNMLVGFRFERNGAMRNIRFELSQHTPLRESIPPVFAHIAFIDVESGGFNALRDLLRQVQRRRLPDGQLIGRLVASTPWLLRAAWWRFVQQRLLYPSGARLQLHLVIEQLPRYDNQVRLSEEKKDAFGQPLAELVWDIAAEDIENVHKAVSAFTDAWPSSTMAPIAALERYPADQYDRELAEGGGIFHPVGSARIATSSDRGVVDADLRPFRVRNVSVVSTAVLPRSGGSNPTMMLLCLGLRCVDLLDRQLS